MVNYWNATVGDDKMSPQAREIVQVRKRSALMQECEGKEGQDPVMVLLLPHGLVPVFAG